jgi:hypothetical protein
MKKILTTLQFLVSAICLGQNIHLTDSLGRRLMSEPTGKGLTVQGEITHPSVHYATAVALPSGYTYNNGTAGVGATLTDSTDRFLLVDNDTVVLNDRILICMQSNAIQNGIYSVTTKGDASHATILTRGPYASIGVNMASGSHVFVDSGFNNKGKIYFQRTTGVVTFGTTALHYVSLYTTGWITPDSNTRIYCGTFRPTSMGGYGNPIPWRWLSTSDGHELVGFTTAIDASNGGITLYYPTATYIQTFLATDDETLQYWDVFCGATVGLDSATVRASRPIINGGYLVGNGTASPTFNQTLIVSNGTLQTSYAPTTGTVYLTSSDLTNPLANGFTATYQGTHNYHLQRIFTGLFSANAAWVILDAGGNTVTDTLTSADVIDFTGAGNISSVPVNAVIADATSYDVYNSTFANYWAIMVCSVNPLDPDPTTGFSAGSPSTGHVTVSWNATNKATSYTLKRSTQQNENFVTVYTGATPSFGDTGLTTGVVYYYWLSATAPSGAGTISNGWITTSVTSL